MEEQKKEEQSTESKEEKKSEGPKDMKGLVGQLEALLDEYMVKKAPFALPKEVKEFIVKISPYLVIILALMAVPAILVALGFTAIVAPFAMLGVYTWGFGAMIALIASSIAIVMEVMAVPGLFNRTKASWRLVFYASIVSLVGGIISLHGVFGAIIGTIIGWYILFQVKELYKN